ncbi:arginase family protein [Rhodobacteraceae bacterium nBUS_22]
MRKMSDAQLARLKELDKDAFDFSDPQITAFFERALPAGYVLDSSAFRAQPGFFQAPHRKDLDGVDIAIVGSPVDLGAIGLSGTRHGPEACRKSSTNNGPIHDVTGKIPFDQCSIIDYGDIEWSATRLDQRVKEDIAGTFHELASAGVATLNCGGEHTTTFGALKGISEGRGCEAFGLLHIDAHSDTMAVWGGDTINDGSVFRQAALNGYIDPERTVQIGIRGYANFLWDFAHDSGMTVIYADEVHEKGINWVMDKAREIIGPDPAYLSFDVDSLDSSHMMGTTGPAAFGLTPRQVRSMILRARELNIIAADMVELNPNRDVNGYCAHVAAALFWELLCLLADNIEANGSPRGQTVWV